MSTRRALVFSFIDRYASHMLAVISVVILSRLLTPREIGLFSIPMIFVALLSSLRDFGAGQYLVQERELTPARIRAVWTVQLGLGFILTLAVAALSGPVANYFDDPEIRPLMQILALNFMITPFGSITYAWLSRMMLFGQLTVLRLSGALATAATGITLAYLGYGAASLAWANLAGVIATALVANFFRPGHLPWLPGLSELSRVMTFGVHLITFSILQTLRQESPLFFLGKLQDTTSAGLYSRAAGLVNLFNLFVLQAVYAVTLPAFARAQREGRGTEDVFLHAVACLTALGWAFSVAVVLLAHPLIAVVYGAQWLESVDLVRALAVAAAPAVPAYLCVQILTSKGLIRINVRLAAVSTATALPAVLLASYIDRVAVAWVAVPISCLMMLLWSRASARVLAIDRSQMTRILLQSAAVACGSNVIPGLVMLTFGLAPAAPVLPLFLAAAGGLIGFVVTLKAVDHPLAKEFEVVKRSMRLLRKRAQ